MSQREYEKLKEGVKAQNKSHYQNCYSQSSHALLATDRLKLKLA